VNVVLWIATALLVAVFGFSAAVKGTQSREHAVELGMTGVAAVSTRAMRAAALAEVAGIAGLILPYATGIVPVLTPLAALGLGVIMVLAAGIHRRLHEPAAAVGNLVILAVCLFVAVGRWPGA
jgi:hypothetical protein